jgi:predicted dehydrogenase
MLAENYRYLTEVELVKQLADAGKFGELYYAEGAYLHDCRALRRFPDGSLTWRGRYPAGILYCTHSLAPLNYWFNERIVTVNCQDTATSDGHTRLKETHALAESDNAFCRTEAGSLFHVRVDVNSPRPHQMAQYHLQGSQGAYESARGSGDWARVYFTDHDGPDDNARWERLSNYAEAFLPEIRRHPPDEATKGGHGTSEYFLCREFLDALEGHRPIPIDVYAALNCTAPGLYAVESKRRDGEPFSIPDFRLL